MHFVNQASVYACPKTITKSGYLTPLFARQCNAVCPFRLLALIVQRYIHSVSVVLSFSYFRFSNKYRGLMALWESISVYIEPFPRERKNEKTIVKNTHTKKPHSLSAATTAGICLAVTQIIRTHRHGGCRMVRWCWVNFQCWGVLLILIIVRQGPTALTVGAGGGCLDIFTLVYQFSFRYPSLWETARYRLKYCLKGPLSPKQPTN